MDDDSRLFFPSVYTGPPAAPGVVWHYTTGSAARKIVASKALLPQQQRYMDRPTPAGKKPLLWFSKNHIFEPCACHELPLYIEWQKRGIPVSRSTPFTSTRLVRFAVSEDKAPYDHHTCFKLAGFSPSVSRALAAIGTQRGGHIEDWRGTLDKVDASEWLSIEIWKRDHWEVVWSNQNAP